MKKTANGLVIREVATGESDKLITVLTENEGKLVISAKGARSIKSKNGALCRLFTYANFEYYEKSGRYWLASGEVIDSFFGITDSIEGLSLAAYIVDVANEVSGENLADEILLRATLNTLYAIQKGLRPLPVIKGAYEFFVSAHSGFAPDLSACERCGGKLDEGFCLDVMNGALLCSECISHKRLTEFDELPEFDRFATRNVLLPLTNEVARAIDFVIRADVKRLFSFNLTNEEDRSLFSRAGEIYIKNHLERGFDTLDFYHSVTEQ